MTEEQVKAAIKVVPNNYICHYQEGLNSIWLAHKHGIAHARILWWDDDKDAICLNDLSVSSSHQKNGVGLNLQIIREIMAIAMGVSQTYLWVDKTTWMYSWYQRRGYSYLKDYDEEPNAVWMTKDINYKDK